MRTTLIVLCAAVLVGACGSGAASFQASGAGVPAASGVPSAATGSAAPPASGSGSAPASASASGSGPASPLPSAAATPAAAAGSTSAPAAASAPTSAPGPSASSSSAASPAPTVAATAQGSTPPLTAKNWRRLEAAGPSAREDQTWTVDGEARFAYLFGGRAGGDVFGDLWRFDLTIDQWQRLAPPEGPKPRFGHTANWVPGVGLVVFSGQAGGDFFNDLWAYTPETNAWRQLPSAGSVPESRYGSCAALAPDGRLWISHGFTDKGRFFDTRAYDFAKSEWIDISRENPIPVVRCLHDCVWTADGRFVLYGGQTNGVPALGDLWARPAGGDWQPQADPPLKARQLYAVTTLGNIAWIFGGADKEHTPLRDLWTLDLGDLSWHEVSLGGSIPPARLSGTFVADPARARLLLFGGKSSQTTYDDLWELRLT